MVEPVSEGGGQDRIPKDLRFRQKEFTSPGTPEFDDCNWWHESGEHRLGDR